MCVLKYYRFFFYSKLCIPEYNKVVREGNTNCQFSQLCTFINVLYVVYYSGHSSSIHSQQWPPSLTRT